MEYPTFGLTKNFPNLSYDSALEKAVEALKSEGFGVLTEIDVKKTLKKKQKKKNQKKKRKNNY